MPAPIRAHLATQPDSATLESLAVLADRALAAEEDVKESKPGVAEIKVEETTKLVGLLEDLSKRIKRLETVTTSERKRNKGRGRANNYAHAPHLPLMYRPQVSLAPNLVSIEMHNKMFDLSQRKLRKIMSHNRPTQPLHRFAITTTLMVKRRACAVNPVHTMSH